MPSDLPNPRRPGIRRCLRRFRSVAVVAAIVAGGGGGQHTATGGEADGGDVEPLARCAVQPVIVSDGKAMRSPLAAGSGLAPSNGVAANYRRSRSGDWDVPADVDRNDPRVRVLLATPGGPMIVELLVSVDGRSFRATREEWIDAALAAAEPAADTEVEPSQSVTETGDAEDADEPSEPAGVSAETHEQSGAQRRLRRYVRHSRIDVERDEARWLLAQWVPGPALLQLREDFAAERASFAPLWAMLDENGDRQLSQEEIGSATARLRARDDNEDDWVDLAELTAGRPAVVRAWRPPSLGTVLSDATDWNRMRHQWAGLYGPESGRSASPLLLRILGDLGVAPVASLSADHLKRLTEVPADVVVRVDLGTNDGTETGVAVMQLSEPLRSVEETPATSEQAIVLRGEGCVIELAAAQPPWDNDAANGGNGQISVGTVQDGSPLLRMVDADGDRRLSLREIESIPAMLDGLDANGDDDVSAGEVPIPIRLMVTLGPHAHDMLKSPSASAFVARPTKVTAPDWFAGMDDNSDGDLTAAEFLGTRKQFDQLDRDGNGRISAGEAAALPDP